MTKINDRKLRVKDISENFFFFFGVLEANDIGKLWEHWSREKRQNII